MNEWTPRERLLLAAIVVAFVAMFVRVAIQGWG